MSEIVVGSRGSRLALAQTRSVVAGIGSVAPELSVRVKIIKTAGDVIGSVPITDIGERGVFVKEIEATLLSGEIDLAVHSAKDLPSRMEDGLCAAAYPRRESPSDALVVRRGFPHDLPDGAAVGTSSVRRRSQLLAARPDLRIVDLRGNVDTRLAKLDRGEIDAAVLACAGLIRLGLADRITQVLPHDVCLPAVGQGALAVQCLEGSEMVEVLARLDDAPTRRAVEAERAFLRELDAGCSTPVAALGWEDNGILHLEGLVARPDGSRVLRTRASGTIDHPEELGMTVARGLIDQGAAELLVGTQRGGDAAGMGAV